MVERETREDWEKEQREDRDREKRDERELSQQFEEEDKEHQHLPLLVVLLPQDCISPEFPTRFCSKALQQWSISLQRSGLVKGLARDNGCDKMANN